MALLRTRRLSIGRLLTLEFEVPGARVAGTVYTVPAGTRTVVRELTIAMHVPNAELPWMQVWIMEAKSGEWFTVFHTTAAAAAADTGLHVSLDGVLEANDKLDLSSNASDMTYWISGAELPLPEA